MKRQLEAMVANRGRSPAQVFGEKARAGELVEPLHGAAAHARARRRARPRARCWRSIASASRTRPTSRSSWSARSRSTRSCPLLAQYVGSLPSTGKATLGVQRRRHPLSRRRASGARREGDASRAARRSSASSPIRRPIPAEQEQVAAADDGARDRAARHPARGRSDRPTPCRSASSQPLPQRGDGHIAGELRRGARERRRR